MYRVPTLCKGQCLLPRAPPKSIESQQGVYTRTMFRVLYHIVPTFLGNSCALSVNGLDQMYSVRDWATALQLSPSQQTPVDGKEGQRSCQRKNNKNLKINHILPFVIPNLGAAAWNSDGGETTGNGQREIKRRCRKHEGPAELTFVYRRCYVLLLLCYL